MSSMMIVFFFFNDTATTEIYTLSLHDALPIFEVLARLASSSAVWKATSSRWSTMYCATSFCDRENSSNRAWMYSERLCGPASAGRGAGGGGAGRVIGRPFFGRGAGGGFPPAWTW